MALGSKNGRQRMYTQLHSNFVTELSLTGFHVNFSTSREGILPSFIDEEALAP
jgi:hypothetical protein